MFQPHIKSGSLDIGLVPNNDLFLRCLYVAMPKTVTRALSPNHRSMTSKSGMSTCPSCIDIRWRGTALSVPKKLTSSTANLEWCHVHFLRDSYITISVEWLDQAKSPWRYVSTEKFTLNLHKTRTTRTPAFWGYPRRPVITHTIDHFVLNPKSILLTSSYRIPGQKKVKAEKIRKSCEKFKF